MAGKSVKNACKVTNKFCRVSEHGHEDYEFVLLLLTLPYTEETQVHKEDDHCQHYYLLMNLNHWVKSIHPQFIYT